MKKIFLNKVIKGDCSLLVQSKYYIYIRTKWNDQKVSLLLLDSETNTCYKGILTIDDFKEAASELEIVYDNYYEECQLALTTQNHPTQFLYELDTQKNKLQIRKLPMNCLYLDIDLKRSGTHYELLDEAIELIRLNDQAKLKCYDHTYEDNKPNPKEEFDVKCHMLKLEEMRKELLIKFLSLLNAKKQRISELEQLVAKHSQSIDNKYCSKDDDAVNRMADDFDKPNISNPTKYIDSDRD